MTKDDEKDVEAAGSGEAIVAKAYPAPKFPSAEEVEAHNLTHLPYRSWCKWCVMSRRPNAPHRSGGRKERSLPLLVGDYCFLRDARDESLMPVFIGRMCPSLSVVVIPCTNKGAIDDYAINRLADFIRNTGVRHLVYMSDQEGSIRNLFKAALNKLSQDGEILTAVPEASAVGESQSNGLSERVVQTLEDLVRTYKLVIEDRMQKPLSNKHALFKWILEHAGAVCNRYQMEEDGETAYQRVHGKRAEERTI